MVPHPPPACHVSNLILSHSFAGFRFPVFQVFFLFFVFVLFIISLNFSPRFIDDDNDVMIPYDSILHKYGFIAWSRVRVTERILSADFCLFFGCLWLSRDEPVLRLRWCPGHLRWRRERRCFLATDNSGPQTPPPTPIDGLGQLMRRTTPSLQQRSTFSLQVYYLHDNHIPLSSLFPRQSNKKIKRIR